MAMGICVDDAKRAKTRSENARTVAEAPPAGQAGQPRSAFNDADDLTAKRIDAANRSFDRFLERFEGCVDLVHGQPVFLR